MHSQTQQLPRHIFPFTDFYQTLQIQSKCVFSLIKSNNANSIQMSQPISRNNLKSTVGIWFFLRMRAKNPNSWSNVKETFAWSKSSQNQPNPTQTVWIVLEPWKPMKTLILSDWREKSVWPILEPVWKIRKRLKLWFLMEKYEGKFWGTTVSHVQSSWTWRVRLASLPFATRG